MKPPCKATRQRPPNALHPNSLGFKKSKPKNMEVKKNLKVWFNVNPEIISSEKNSFHKSLNELLSMKQQRRVLGSKSLSDLEIDKLSHKDFLKSCSSQSTLLGPANTHNHGNRRYFDNLVSSYDDSYLEDDICMKRRNIPRKSILKNKSHASYLNGSYHNCRPLWERKCDSFNSFESENSWTSLGMNSDSITKLYKCSEPYNPMTYPSEKEMFDDLTSSIKRLHISQLSLSEAMNSSQYMNLLYGSQNHCNEMSKLLFGHASNEISEELNSSVLSWSDKNNSSHTSEENFSPKEDQNSSNSSTDKRESNTNASTLVGPKISFHLESASETHSSNSGPHLERSFTEVSDVFETNSNCCCHNDKIGGNYLTNTDHIQDDGEIKILSKETHQVDVVDVKECSDVGETDYHRDTLLMCPVVNCGVCFNDPNLLAKHMSDLEHSSCNPAASLLNGILPTSSRCMCPLCGHISWDENSCLQHMFRKKHAILLPTVPFVVFTCPQCLSFFPSFSLALQHMDRSNHYTTAFSFVDDRNNRTEPCPIPMPCKVMMEFVSRCQQAEYVLQCENCLENLYSPQQLQFHINNQHTVLSICDRKAVDVFSTLLTDKSCAECHQFIYKPFPEKQLCIHTACPLQGPVITLKARSLKEFILRCGIADINIAIASKNMLTLNGHLDNDVKKVFKTPRSKPCLDEPKIGQSKVESTKKTMENHPSIANNSNPYGEGTSKQCLEQMNYCQSKLGHSSHVQSVTGKETNGPDSSNFRRDKHLVQDVLKLKRKCDFTSMSEPTIKVMVLADAAGSEVKDKSSICRALCMASTQTSTLEHGGEEHFRNPNLSSPGYFLIDNNTSWMFEVKGDFNTELDTNEDDELKNWSNFVNSLHDSSQQRATKKDSEMEKYGNTAYPDYIPLNQLPGPCRKKHLTAKRKVHRYWECVSKKSPYKYSSSNPFYYKLHHHQQSVMDNIHVASMIKAATVYKCRGSERITSYRETPLMLRLNGPFSGATSKKPSVAECANLKKMISPQMKHLAFMDRIIFADLENYQFFKSCKGPILPWTYVWGFISARPRSPFHLENYYYKFPLYLALKELEYVHISTDIGTSKDAADFALCLAIAKLDDRLPTSIPFFIVSRDKGFREIENQMKFSERQVIVVSPGEHLHFADFF